MNDKGISLVEVIATLVILSIVAVFIMGIISSSANTHVKQVSANKQLFDVSYVLKLVTKDARRTTDLTHHGDTYTFTSSLDPSLLFTYTFEKDNKELYRSEAGGSPQLIATQVELFKIIGTIDLVINLELKDQNGKILKGNTQIFFRK